MIKVNNSNLYESIMKDVSKIIKKHLEYKLQTNKELRNNIIGKRLNEGQIDGLRDVKIIRHYTTGSALKSILKSGIIEARISRGDSDWEGYDLYDNCVVSFHDVRTDPEYKEIIDQNSKKSWHGGTRTLGQHADKICCCIEIDYDKLDKLIQDQTHLLNIYGKKAEEFINLWNYLVCFKDVQEEITGINDISLELLDLCNNKSDQQLMSNLYLDLYQNDESYKDKKYESIWKKIEQIFKRNFPSIKDLYGTNGFWEVPGKSGKDGYYDLFIVNAFDYIAGNLFWTNGELKDQNDLNQNKKQWKLRSEFYRRNLKKFTKEESQQLSEYAIKFDVISIVKMLKNHGWRFGDSLLDEFYTTNGWGTNERQQKPAYFDDHNDNDYYDGSLIYWIDQLAKNKKRIINANIEIRIASDIMLNKDNCKIIIFNGICEATKQNSLINLPKKYYEKYNIEHIE